METRAEDKAEDTCVNVERFALSLWKKDCSQWEEVILSAGHEPFPSWSLYQCNNLWTQIVHCKKSLPDVLICGINASKEVALTTVSILEYKDGKIEYTTLSIALNLA